MATFKRIILLVLDSAGVGAMPDAGKFGDEGADTLGNVFKASDINFGLINLAGLGLYGLLNPALGLLKINAKGSFGKMACASPAKDTTAGHWELAGIILEKPFPTYPNGFPQELIQEFEKLIGEKILGNRTASGTVIINELGDEHVKTGCPIVYTSADSVFQVAAHEKTFGLERLYEACRAAREMLTGEHAVGRVIARPFTGGNGNYSRTENRRDYSLDPFEETVLDRAKNAGMHVVGIGKIEDIYNGKGITDAMHTHSNKEGMNSIKEQLIHGYENVLIFANLVDFDMLWGHRRDAVGYARGLKEFDEFLPQILALLKEDDMLIITADHGCDPTYTKHTDHTREYVPVLVYGKKVKAGVDLGTRPTFADAAQTIAEALGLGAIKNGTSFLKDIVTGG
ncbi:MAG: phosphopentomutase [Elusimicrobiota bacterium]